MDGTYITTDSTDENDEENQVISICIFADSTRAINPKYMYVYIVRLHIYTLQYPRITLFDGIIYLHM